MAITGEGTYLDFSCTKTIQQFVAPFKGLYKLEVWGGQGGNSTYGGKGGYSLGYKVLKKGETLFVGVGGMGATGSNVSSVAGGYNGGGNGAAQGGPSGGGGGCTHIATMDGTLQAIGVNNKATILIVAGGGGGYRTTSDRGGTGGGLTGGTGAREDTDYTSGTGGTQTKAGGGRTSGSFGKGANASAYAGGGGGGLYGGGGGYGAASGGGSGYIDGVPSIVFKDVTYSPSTRNGVQSGNGKARITFIQKDLTIYLGDISVNGLYLGDISVGDIIPE